MENIKNELCEYLKHYLVTPIIDKQKLYKNNISLYLDNMCAKNNIIRYKVKRTKLPRKLKKKYKKERKLCFTIELTKSMTNVQPFNIVTNI